MKKAFLLFFILCLSASSFAQISYPKVRKFNVGLFMGLGGQSGPVLNLLPALNLSYRGTTLTAGAGLNQGFTVGLNQEIVPVSVSNYNVKWIGSAYYSIGQTDTYYDKDTDYKSIALLTGLKVYFAKRWFSNIQGGVSYTDYTVKGIDSRTEWLPFYEFGLGFRLFKTFEEVKKKDDSE